MNPLVALVVVLARVLNVLILIRVLMSWLPLSRDNQFARVVHDITEPLLAPIRRVIPSVGGLDLSPLILLLALQVLERMVLRLLAF